MSSKTPQEVDFEKDWKLVTIFVGASDLCHYCTDQVRRRSHVSAQTDCTWSMHVVDLHWRTSVLLQNNLSPKNYSHNLMLSLDTLYHEVSWESPLCLSHLCSFGHVSVCLCMFRYRVSWWTWWRSGRSIHWRRLITTRWPALCCQCSFFPFFPFNFWSISGYTVYGKQTCRKACPWWSTSIVWVFLVLKRKCLLFSGWTARVSLTQLRTLQSWTRLNKSIFSTRWVFLFFFSISRFSNIQTF